MRIGVLGTGTVGVTLASRLVELGHDVAMGSRDAQNPKALAWVTLHTKRARAGTFADAAQHGDIVVNATAGTASLDALRLAGADAIATKVLIDVANSLDFSHGMPPSLAVANIDSLGEQVQRAFPEARVVKTLNTMNAAVMAHPERLSGHHNVFMSGDDAAAKVVVAGLLQEFGWPSEDIIDLGGIQTARAAEMYLPLWLALMRTGGDAAFNINVVRA